MSRSPARPLPCADSPEPTAPSSRSGRRRTAAGSGLSWPAGQPLADRKCHCRGVPCLHRRVWGRDVGWFSGLYRKIIVGSWNSPQAAMTARGPGTRKAPGDDCLCGKGFICRASARSTVGSSAAPNSGSPDADMPGRSTAGDCRGIRNHAPLAGDRRGAAVESENQVPRRWRVRIVAGRGLRWWRGGGGLGGRCTVVLARRPRSPTAYGPFEAVN